MISSLLQPMSRDDFFARHFQREPLARPESARGAVRLLTWATVDRLVAAQPDTLTVRNGKLRDTNPSTFAEALTLFRDGWSIVMRRCERHDPHLRRLADAVEQELEGEVAIQIYLTPGGFHSFGWHYDVEDVFIVQTGGRKEYLLRRNTVNPEPTLAAMPRDMQYERETTPTMATTLLPGDWLYVPRGWWHVAHALEDSLSISIGVLSPAAR